MLGLARRLGCTGERGVRQRAGKKSREFKVKSKGRRQYHFTGIHSKSTKPSVYNEEN